MKLLASNKYRAQKFRLIFLGSSHNLAILGSSVGSIVQVLTSFERKVEFPECLKHSTARVPPVPFMSLYDIALDSRDSE